MEKQEKDKEKMAEEELEENETERMGFPEDIDLKKFLGCGG